MRHLYFEVELNIHVITTGLLWSKKHENNQTVCYGMSNVKLCVQIVELSTFLDPRFKELSPFVPEEHECVYKNTKT